MPMEKREAKNLMERYVYAGVGLLALAGAVGIGSRMLGKESGAVTAPRFEVDPFWPKPLPNHWRIGMTIGVAIDAQDHVWIIHRGKSIVPASCTPKPSLRCRMLHQGSTPLSGSTRTGP